MPLKPEIANRSAELRRGAEALLRGRSKGRHSKRERQKFAGDTLRLLHELQVHQLELEMQNAELQEARNRMEGLLEKYTDLYDFAPVGYFSLDAEGVIREVNLTGATLLGVERSRLLNQRLPNFALSDSQLVFKAFLDRVFARAEKQVCEVALKKKDAAVFWASMHGTSTLSDNGGGKWCRIAVSDITYLKEGEQAQRRMKTMALANQALTQEIARRRRVENALRKSEHHSLDLLEQSRQMQEQLRRLSRQLLSAQEEERKKISRELHDVVAQTLTSINVRLANLKSDAQRSAGGLERSVARTQKLVEKSVAIVHRFARELRPTVLDDIGLIPALRAFMKSFREETGVQVSLSAFADVERVNGDKRTVLYRVAQEALTNVGRHAHASRVEMTIQKRDRAVCMKIKDNGKGFQQKQLLRARKQNRLGLLGMQERLEMVGGKLSVASAPGRGTTLVVELPLTERPLLPETMIRSIKAKH